MCVDTVGASCNMQMNLFTVRTFSKYVFTVCIVFVHKMFNEETHMCTLLLAYTHNAL